MEAFEVRQLPTFVSMTDIQSMSILDYVLGAFFHPVFFYTASIGCFIVVLFRMATITDATQKGKLTKFLSTLIVLLIGYNVIPYFVDFFHSLV